MIYFWIKYIHIMSATILFGTGIGTAAVMLYGHYRKNLTAMVVINQYVVLVDGIFTGTSAAMQAISGLYMVYLAGYSFKSFWITASICGYVITMICWFVVVYLQIKIKDITEYALENNTPLPKAYAKYFTYWLILGFIAFFSLLIVFYLMIRKPETIRILYPS